MADVTDVLCAHTTQTLVFSGVGTVVLAPQSSGSYYIGGSGVTNTTGVIVNNAPPYTTLYVTSPDDIYVYNEHALTDGYVRVYHNR
jgi:hypothetical protein